MGTTNIPAASPSLEDIAKIADRAGHALEQTEGLLALFQMLGQIPPAQDKADAEERAEDLARIPGSLTPNLNLIRCALEDIQAAIGNLARPETPDVTVNGTGKIEDGLPVLRA